MEEKYENSGGSEFLGRVFAALVGIWLGLNILFFVQGIIRTKTCGLFVNRDCTTNEYILDRSRWPYLFPGYNAGVNFGMYMNHTDQESK